MSSYHTRMAPACLLTLAVRSGPPRPRWKAPQGCGGAGSKLWFLGKSMARASYMNFAVNGVPGGNATYGKLNSQNGEYVARRAAGQCDHHHHRTTTKDARWRQLSAAPRLTLKGLPRRRRRPPQRRVRSPGCANTNPAPTPHGTCAGAVRPSASNRRRMPRASAPCACWASHLGARRPDVAAIKANGQPPGSSASPRRPAPSPSPRT